MKKDKEKPLANIHKLWLQQSMVHRSKLNIVKLEEKWHSEMGQTISKATKKMKIFRGKLHIEINSAPLRNQLYYQREQIKLWANNHLGEKIITDVILR